MELETYTTVPTDDRRVDGEITLAHRRAVAVGIDVGQAHDPTAIAIVSRITTDTANTALSALNQEPRPRYEVQHLQRLKLGMPYPAQVDVIEDMLLRAPLNRLAPRVLVDWTGVGRPVFDMFAGRHALRRAQGVVITGGRDTTRHGPGWSMPKGELVSKLQALLHAGDLRIAASLPDAPVLQRGLQDFRVRFSDADNAIFNAREGAHDDLVLSSGARGLRAQSSGNSEGLEVVWVGR